MPWYTFLAIYFIIWWLVFFAVLPLGMSREAEETGVAGADPGAPAVPRLGAKVVWTTLIAAVVGAAFYGVYASRLVSLEDLATLWGLLK